MISVNILYGVAFVSQADKWRAEAAAQAVFDAAGVTDEVAHAAFRAWWESTDNQDYAAVPADARIWIDGERAADRALTEGWANPDGAACALSM
jgi:hypothetical protein